MDEFVKSVSKKFTRAGRSEYRKMSETNAADLEAELMYTPKISSPGNYRRFLDLSGAGSLSDDEAGYHSGNEGFIDDELVPEQSPLPEADLYPDLSPTSSDPTVTTPTEAKEQLTEEERKDMTEELEKVEGEIATLRQVLGSKVRYASELKRKLGITPLQEMKTDFQHGLQSIKESTTYQKTTAVAKSAAEKTSHVVSAVGSTVTRKLGDLRNSTTFKSVEGKVESAYATVKRRMSSKVAGSRSEGNFEDALLQDKENNSNGSASPATEAAEEKVPQ